jgi:hypothetical protein
MKPILFLGIIAIAAIGLGMGSLTNVINLDVMQFGVGEETILSPIDDATVKFSIAKTVGNLGFFKNYISECIISSPQDILANSKIFCKLTNEISEVIAEGNKVVTSLVVSNTPITIPIDDPDVINSQVQNVHDVLIVVQGP